MSDLFKDMGLYFNTTSELEKLPEYIGKAKTQNERVLQILTEANTHLSPPQVWAHYQNRYAKCPLTSIRRSLSVLTKKGDIEMVLVKKQGLFGRSNYQWRVKK